MDSFSLQVLSKVPLAQATFRVLSFALEDGFLEAVYQKNRGRSYTKLIRFPLITQLVSDALFQNKSGRRVFEKAHHDEALPASVEAAYKKLGRVPVAVSTALLESTSARVRELFPQRCEETSLPASLAHFSGIVVDGKATKQIPHRLKPLRTEKVGGLVGGRGLVATHLQSGLVLGMEADEDGDANETPWVPRLTEKVRAGNPGPRLWIADRQFSYPSTLAEFSRENDAFVVRYSKAIPFFPDESRESRTGLDADGREYVEEWGWLGVARQQLTENSCVPEVLRQYLGASADDMLRQMFVIAEQKGGYRLLQAYNYLRRQPDFTHSLGLQKIVSMDQLRVRAAGNRFTLLNVKGSGDKLHAIGVEGYNAETQAFLVHDPATGTRYWQTAENLQRRLADPVPGVHQALAFD